MYNFEQILWRLKDAKKVSRLTNKELSQQSSVPLGTVNKIFSGDTKEPKLPAVIALANALNVSVDYLIYGEYKAPALSSTKTRLLKSFRAFNAEGQEKVLSYICDLESTGRYKKANSAGMVAREA
ncbi:MAG: helix-turn-helix transcriptional regulator [Eubacteriales bacterium]|nr:helix-turn-helix transcriptional regulator [Eubacteriales bacterium]